MEKLVQILSLATIAIILSCSEVSGRRPGKREVCQLSPETGRCRASRTRWYYDSTLGECSEFTWGGCGGNGNKFTTKSFCERVCKPGCPRQECSRTCTHGFIIDSDGCTTCSCNPAPEEASCPAIECDPSCPHGYSTDAQGCMTCDCRPDPVRVSRSSSPNKCPPVCYMYCQFGNRLDENGCPLCACKSKEEACGAQQCMMECPTGFQLDSRGCELCQCRPAAEATPSCPNNQCLKECAFGFQKDSFGCEICVCASARSRNRQTTDCSKRPSCRMSCPGGFMKGGDGCDICRCGQSSSGRRNDRQQRRGGNQPSSEDICGVRPMCAMFCPDGFQKDSRGCDICACRGSGSPVQPIQLPAGNSGNSPAQLPANIPAQLPDQIPANVPSSQLDNRPAQLPADVPAHLPVNTNCSPRRCHKRTSCSFGFTKDENGCDTCVCGTARDRSASRRQSLQ